MSSNHHDTHPLHIPYYPLHDHVPSSPLSSETPPLELTSFTRGMPKDTTGFRDSVASQSTFQTAPSALNSSVYALQPNTSGAESIVYQDDPVLTTSRLSDPYLDDKPSAYSSPRSKPRRTILVLASIAAIIVILAAVLSVYFVTVKPKSNNSATSNPSPSGGSGSDSIALVTGGNGSTVTTENGTTFTYFNPFGGIWYWDPEDPFNNNAQPNSWTPPLNQTFNFGTDRIFGSVLFCILSSSSSSSDNCLSLQRQPRRLAYYRTCQFSASLVRSQLTSSPQFMQVDRSM